MKIKKIGSLIIAAILMFFCLSGCGKDDEIKTDPPEQEDGYSIVYHYEDGMTQDKTIEVGEGEKAQLPADPTRSDYGFKGWYTEKDGKGERITVDTVLTEDMDAYAYWTDYVDMTGRNVIDIGGFNGVTEYIRRPMRDPETNEILRDPETGEQLFYDMEYAEEVDFALLQELGVDTIYMTFEHWDLYPDNEHMQNQKPYIEWMNKYDISCWFNDYELNDVLINLAEDLDFNDEDAVAAAVKEVKKYTAVYEDEACFKGNYIRDEPNLEQLESFVKMAKLYQIAMPGYEMYTNLFPNYAWTFHLDMTDELYKEYIQYYVDNFDFSYIAIDNYGILAEKSIFGTVTRSVNENYFWRCFRVVAEIARDSGRDLENHIWTTKDLANTDEGRNYSPNMHDLRFEAFNAMAFGASNINLYCASTPPSVLSANPEFIGGWGCINDGQKTPELFDNASQLVDEIKALSDVFCKYLWQDIGGYDAGGIYGKTLTRELTADYSDRLLSLTSNQDLAIGLFDEANGDGEAFMFVNNCDIDKAPTDESAFATVRFRLVGASKVMAYIGTEQKTLTADSEGFYSFELEPGQGAFVTVER